MKVESKSHSSNKLSRALKQIQLRVQVQVGHSLTHDELARLAGVSKRSLGDWMRGINAPSGMSAIFELLSLLDERDVMSVLRDWQATSSSYDMNKD
jgi:DNA-binding transcriptional regulator YiaG